MASYASESENQLRAELAQILGIYDTRAWSIADRKVSQGLYLIHYDDQHALDEHGLLRGAIVSLSKRRVICRDFEYTPSITIDSIKKTPGVFITEDGIETAIDFSKVDGKNMRLEEGYEGTIVRVFMHGGRVYYSSHKKIDCSNSRWGGQTKTFIEMYKLAGGPAVDELFPELAFWENSFPGNIGGNPDVYDMDETYARDECEDSLYNPDSPLCYIFLVSDPENLVVSKNPMIEGKIVFLGVYNSMENRMVDCSDRVFINPDIKAPEPLTVREANKVLKYGHYDESKLPDIRLYYGEFVILRIRVKYGELETDRLVCLQSSNYKRRKEIRAGVPNIEHRYYCLQSDAHFDPSMNFDLRERFLEKYINFEKMSPEDLTRRILEGSNLPLAKALPKTQKDLQYLLFVNLLHAIPIPAQQANITLYTRFLGDQQWLADFTLHQRQLLPKETVYNFEKAMGSANAVAKNRLERAKQNSDKPNDRELFLALLKVFSETQGDRLYKMLGDARRYVRLVSATAKKAAMEDQSMSPQPMMMVV